MDRFVWFVLLVVMSHLVTEFTRVHGNTRGGTARNEPNAMANDSLPQGKQVQSLVFFPAHEHAGYYPPIPPPPHQQPYLQAPPPGYANAMNNNNNNNNNNGYNAPLVLPPAANFGSAGPNNNNNNNNFNGVNGGIGATVSVGQNGQTNIAGGATAATTGFGFSLRPLIDSIFEIPISTLRAVNNLVARLTGSYQHQSTPGNANAGMAAGMAGRTAATSAFTSPSASASASATSGDTLVGFSARAARAGGLLAALAAHQNAAKPTIAATTTTGAAAAAASITTATTSKATQKSASLLREVNA